MKQNCPQLVEFPSLAQQQQWLALLDDEDTASFSPAALISNNATHFFSQANKTPILTKKDVLLSSYPNYQSPVDNNSNSSNSPPWFIDCSSKSNQTPAVGLKNECTNFELSSFCFDRSDKINQSSSPSSFSQLCQNVWQDGFFEFDSAHFIPQIDEFPAENFAQSSEINNINHQDQELARIIDNASKMTTIIEPGEISNSRSSVEEIFKEIYAECEQNFVAEQQCDENGLDLSNVVEIDLDQQTIDLSSISQPQYDDDDESDYDDDYSTTESDVRSTCSPANDARKKCQNRRAASRYRNRRKMACTILKSERQQLEKKNAELKSRVVEFEREIAYLKNFMQEIQNLKKKS